MCISNSELETILYEFADCRDLRRLEELADRIGVIGDQRAIEPLLQRLGDDHVQEDPDVEDAVCDALVKLGTMRKIGNLNYRFLPNTQLPNGVSEILVQLRQLIPRKYIESNA